MWPRQHKSEQEDAGWLQAKPHWLVVVVAAANVPPASRIHQSSQTYISPSSRCYLPGHALGKLAHTQKYGQLGVSVAVEAVVALLGMQIIKPDPAC